MQRCDLAFLKIGYWCLNPFHFDSHIFLCVLLISNCFKSVNFWSEFKRNIKEGEVLTHSLRSLVRRTRFARSHRLDWSDLRSIKLCYSFSETGTYLFIIFWISQFSCMSKIFWVNVLYRSREISWSNVFHNITS